MSNSLVYGGIELLGGGVVQPDGWSARLAPGWDLGAAEPETTVVDQLLLDGERVTGDRSGDRTISLPVVIEAPVVQFGTSSRAVLGKGIAALQKLVNARTSTLLWTPDPTIGVFDGLKTPNLIARNAQLSNSFLGPVVGGGNVVTDGWWVYDFAGPTPTGQSVAAVDPLLPGGGGEGVRLSWTGGNAGNKGIALDPDNAMPFEQGQWYTISFYALLSGTIGAPASIWNLAWNHNPDVTNALTPVAPTPGVWQRVAFAVRWNTSAPDTQIFPCIAEFGASTNTGPIVIAFPQVELGTQMSPWKASPIASWQRQGYLAPLSPKTSVFDTFRGRTAVGWAVKEQGAGIAQVSLDLTALPYSRNPAKASVTVGAATVQLDDLDSGTAPAGGFGGGGGLTFASNTWTIAGANPHIEGTAAARINATVTGTLPAASTRDLTLTAGRTGLAAVDLSAASTVAPAFYWTFRPNLLGSAVTVTPGTATLTLIDGTGQVVTLYASPPPPAGAGSSYGRISFPVPASWPATFDPTNVTGWAFSAVMVLSTASTVTFIAMPITAGIDDIEGFPPGTADVVVANGGTYRFGGIGGTARCPVSIQATLAGGIDALVLHKAPAEARPDYAPLVPYTSLGHALGTAAPMPAYAGSTAGARYNGTHAIWLCASLTGIAASGTVTVTFTETHGDPISGGTDTTVTSRAIVVGGAIVNGLLDMGLLTLPARAVQPDNTATSITVTVAYAGGGTFACQDVLVLDTRGPTVIVGQAFGRDTVWVDEPDPTTGVGQVLIGNTVSGSSNGRASAVAVWDSTSTDPGPLSFDPADNVLLGYCPQGAVDLTATYAERYLAEAI